MLPMRAVTSGLTPSYVYLRGLTLVQRAKNVVGLSSAIKSNVSPTFRCRNSICLLCTSEVHGLAFDLGGVVRSSDARCTVTPAHVQHPSASGRVHDGAASSLYPFDPVATDATVHKDRDAVTVLDRILKSCGVLHSDNVVCHVSPPSQDDRLTLRSRSEAWCLCS